MKNKIKFFGVLVIMVAAVFVFAGCAFMQAAPVVAEINYQNWGVFGEAAVIPIKDFESKGLVFTEVSFVVKSDGQIEGATFTYQALLKEAQKLNADAIINVTIDKKVDKVTEGRQSFKRETWYGSALAIKYTAGAVLPPQSDTDVPVNARRTYQTGGRASSSTE